MTKQEAYEQIRAYFTQEGAALAKRKPKDEDEAQEYGLPSTNDWLCQYRTETGAACAVGCLIPDELYDLGMEAVPARSLLKSYPAVAEHLGVTTIELGDYYGGLVTFLAQAQEAHDSDETLRVHDFIRQLDTLAESHDLTPVGEL